MEEGVPIEHRFVTRAIRNAQEKVEAHNFDMRKHLLEYDDVLNQQRKYIYEQRDEILRDPDLVSRVVASARDMVDGLLEAYDEGAGNDRTAAWAALRESLREEFNVALPFTLESPELAKVEALREAAHAALDANIDEKVAYAGAANLGNFIRYQYLQSIDQKWLDHLENMEGLREAVHLRHYAQKNPLLEYKLEGFQIFETMIDEIRTGLARRVFLVRVGGAEERRRSVAAPAAVAVHPELGQFGGIGRAPAAAQSRAAPAMPVPPRPAAAPQGSLADIARASSATVERHGPKVGRNDPCPCGSGKKYKHCHGR
jgi:preprotein translocase subunit SecA